jgi:hypothetical protein
MESDCKSPKILCRWGCCCIPLTELANLALGARHGGGDGCSTPRQSGSESEVAALRRAASLSRPLP